MAISCTISISHGSVVVVVMDISQGSEILQGKEKSLNGQQREAGAVVLTCSLSLI